MIRKNFNSALGGGRQYKSPVIKVTILRNQGFICQSKQYFGGITTDALDSDFSDGLDD